MDRGVYLKYKLENSLEERQKESKRILNSYPDKVPVICEKDPYSKYAKTLECSQYLVPFDTTVEQFLFMIKKKLGLGSSSGIFLITVKGSRLFGEEKMKDIYHFYKDSEDNLLYLIYMRELN